MTKSHKKSKQVHWVEMPDQLILKDTRMNADEKSIEELITVPANEVEDRCFLIGSSMRDGKWERLVNFLKENI